MWKAKAPSNIALIKYMGKTKDAGNRPTNASLSYTLSHFVTEVQIEKAERDEWQPLVKKGYYVQLSEKGRERFLKFFSNLKRTFGIEGKYLIRSSNNFPSDCGLASSASSFAALTKAAYQLSLDEGSGKECFPLELSKISQGGSGSSCRSFFAPWALWANEGAEDIELPFEHLIHQVIIVEEKEKLVSSSEAHTRVMDSALFNGRPERAEQRLSSLIKALRAKDWQTAYEVTWQEFWDMHALFETSAKPFGYMSAESMEALSLARELWLAEGDGPLITMDAGPNVHLLFRPDQKSLAQRLRDQIEETDSSTRVIGNDVETI